MDPVNTSHNYHIDTFISCRSKNLNCCYSLNHRQFMPLFVKNDDPDLITELDQLIGKINELSLYIPLNTLTDLIRLTHQYPVTLALLRERIKLEQTFDEYKDKFKNLTFVFVDQPDFPKLAQMKSSFVYYKFVRENESEIYPEVTTLAFDKMQTIDFMNQDWSSISRLIEYTQHSLTYSEFCAYLKEKRIKTLPFHLGNRIEHLPYFKANLLIAISKDASEIEISYNNPKGHKRSFRKPVLNKMDLFKLFLQAQISFLASGYESTQLLLDKNASRAPKGAPPVLKDIKLDNLVALFDNIVFERPPTDDGVQRTVEQFQRNLKSFLNKTLNNSEHGGVPPKSKEREEFYTSIKGYLTHIIKFLQENEKEDKTKTNEEQRIAKRFRETYITDIAEASFHCGGRWMGVVINVWNSIINALPSSDNVEEKFLEWIDRYKSGIVKKMVSGSNQQSAHEFIYYCARLQAQGISIPGAGGAIYNDVYENLGRLGRYRSDEGILEGFMKEFTGEALAAHVFSALTLEIEKTKGKKLGPIVDVLRACVEISSEHVKEIETQHKILLKNIEEDPALHTEAIQNELKYGLDLLHTEKSGAPEPMKIKTGNSPTLIQQREVLQEIYLRMRQSLQYEEEKYRAAKPKATLFIDKITLQNERNGNCLKEREEADAKYTKKITAWKQERFDQLQEIKTVKINALKDELLQAQGLGEWDEDGVLTGINAQAVVALLKYFNFIRPLTTG